MDGIWYKNKLGEINPMLKKEKPWDMIDDLMELDMKPLIDHLQYIKKRNKNYFRNLSLMTNCSKYQLGG